MKTVEATPESANEILARLMLEERAEKQAEKQLTIDRAKAAREKVVEQQQIMLKNQARLTSVCDHLQGNHKLGEMPFKEVTHLSLHTYGDNSRRIRCNKCGFRWLPGDTAEFITRNGEKKPNPTGIGWKEAYKTVMRFVNSGNKPSKGFTTQIIAAPPPEE